MKVFISGGCKNGKSSYAQDLSLRIRRPDAPLYYLATMVPTDNEDEARIKMHREDREGYGFKTVEAGRDILCAVNGCDMRGVFLLDSVTALLANEMFLPDGSVRNDAHIKISKDLTGLCAGAGGIVIVSDYIYSDAFLYDGLTQSYRRALAYIDRRMAAVCDVVLEACGGNIIIHKGKDILGELADGAH